MESYRVLVVDDEEEFVSTLVERLQLRAIDAEGVTRGAEALELLKEREFDIILLDVKMPGLGGLEVIRRIKAVHPKTEVILLTGHSSAEAVEEGMNAGALEYLMKPVDIEDLIRLFKRASGDRKDLMDHE
jgi:two-component system OmpR family response regulator